MIPNRRLIRSKNLRPSINCWSMRKNRQRRKIWCLWITAPSSIHHFAKNFYVETAEIRRMSEEEVKLLRAELDNIKIGD